MYSFVIRAHQKIDKAAYTQLKSQLGKSPLISLKEILYFEGSRGPDSARLKHGKSDVPWHFYKPGEANKLFIKVLYDHYSSLVEKLKVGNIEGSAFEAAWLAHALVDGLTPAHHYPYEDELKAIRNSDKSTRETVGSHFIVKGDTPKETIKKSFRLIGPKGLLTTHTTFEAGAAMIIMPLNLAVIKYDFSNENGSYGIDSLIETFRLFASEIQSLNMYDRFYKHGWTPWLARDIKKELAPRMVSIVYYAWYSAFYEAGLIDSQI